MSVFKKICSKSSHFLRTYSEKIKYVRKVREVTKEQIIWYPGHINKGVEQLNQRLVEADAIIEVHDCRIPLTGRSNLLSSYEEVKPKILILNKVDLISKKEQKKVEDRILKISNWNNCFKTEVIFTQLNNPGEQNKLLERINSTLLSALGEQSHVKSANHVLVTGIPNVGKSTFINSLRTWNSVHMGYAKHRSHKPVSVGPRAGVTRNVSYKILISDGPPPLFVLDSPGIWEPSKEDIEGVLKMALCGCFNFDSMYKEVVIDYMLYMLNKHAVLDYVRYYDMPEATDDVVEFVQRICMARGLIQKKNKLRAGQCYGPDFNLGFNQAFLDFNRGNLGQIVLDDLQEPDKAGYRHHNTAALGTIISARRDSRPRIPFVWASNISVPKF